MVESEHNQKASQYGPYEFRLGDELRGERATRGKSLLDVQRDLRIKAAYVAAIENCEPEVFPNPSFIAGYVRSYARYLELDPDEIYWRFCAESGFGGIHAGGGGRARAKGPAAPGTAKAAGVRATGVFKPDFPLAQARRRGLPEIPVSAIGSLLVLVALIGALGYGGWAILQNIQRVQFAPVDEVPIALAEVEALLPPEAGASEPMLPELASPVAATALVDLYRQQELEVPILVPRDGPIAAIDPDRIGLFAGARPETAAVASLATGPPVPGTDPGAEVAGAPPEPQVTASTEPPRLKVLAERPAWIRVYLGDGTVIFERILESGEAYEVPADVELPRVWAGNSGSVYVSVAGEVHGPIGRGTRAVRDVVLEAEAISERFEVVDEVPAVIFETMGNLARQADAVLIQ